MTDPGWFFKVQDGYTARYCPACRIAWQGMEVKAECPQCGAPGQSLREPPTEPDPRLSHQQDPRRAKPQ